MKEKKDKKKLNPIYLMRKAAPAVIKAVPFAFTLTCLFSVALALLATLGVSVLRRFFDSASELAASGGVLADVLPPLLWLCGFRIGERLVQAGINLYTNQYFFERSQLKLGSFVHVKSGRIPPAMFENKEFNDDLEKATNGMYCSVYYVYIAVMLLAYYIPYFIAMSWYLFTLKPILALSIVLIFVPVFFTQGVWARMFADKEDTVGPLRRKMNYYDKVLTSRDYFKEVRLLGAGHLFRTLYQSVQLVFMKTEWKTIRKTQTLKFFGKIFTLAGYSGVLWMLLDALLGGDITVGAFAAVFTAVEAMFGRMEQLAYSLTSDVSEMSGQVSNFVSFLGMPEQTGEPAEPEDAGIRLENVSFTYPGREEKAVDGVTLDIAPGETVAVVGENGAGKSTLVRLMTGIYTPDEGRVSVGGADTAKTSPTSLRRNMSAVFQKFVKYKLTLRENVAISAGKLDGEDEKIAKACAQAGLDLSGDYLPQGLDTNLSREFDGTDLSGGQWQRVAIARGLYRESGIIVLDEPTAAIDPIEESRLYASFADISRGKTAILVTHRLGSARIAGRIIVMDKGRIAEIGTHSELMERKGLYAEMFGAQAKWYA